MAGEGQAEAVTGLLAAFRPGSRLAGYVLEEQVGAGGMAVVFRAWDQRLRRRVALKILAPGLASDRAFRQRFIRESQAAAAVNDPCIIPVFEAGEAEGVLFIAMPLVSGKDVRTLLQNEGPLPPGRAAGIISQVASALDAAHATGLVHRDVKPANMLIHVRPGRPDHVYLADFGISRDNMTSAGLTGTGQFIGTPEYAAPEQIERIEGREVDGRADQYALACAAFELLAGKTPFHRDHVWAILRAQLDEPPPLGSLRPGLPGAVDAVFARGLAKSPQDRFASCHEFAEALATALDLAPGAADPAANEKAPPAGDHAPPANVPPDSLTPAPDALRTVTTPQLPREPPTVRPPPPPTPPSPPVARPIRKRVAFAGAGAALAGAVAELLGEVLGWYPFRIVNLPFAYFFFGLAVYVVVAAAALAALLQIGRLVIFAYLQGMLWLGVSTWIIGIVRISPGEFGFGSRLMVANNIEYIGAVLLVIAAMLLLVSWSPAVDRRPARGLPLTLVAAAGLSQVPVLIFYMNLGFLHPSLLEILGGVIAFAVFAVTSYMGVRASALGGALVLAWIILAAERSYFPGTAGSVGAFVALAVTWYAMSLRARALGGALVLGWVTFESMALIVIMTQWWSDSSWIFKRSDIARYWVIAGYVMLVAVAGLAIIYSRRRQTEKTGTN